MRWREDRRFILDAPCHRVLDDVPIVQVSHYRARKKPKAKATDALAVWVRTDSCTKLGGWPVKGRATLLVLPNEKCRRGKGRLISGRVCTEGKTKRRLPKLEDGESYRDVIHLVRVPSTSIRP